MFEEIFKDHSESIWRNIWEYLKITSNVTLFCQIPSSSFISSTSEIVAFTFTEIQFLYLILFPFLSNSEWKLCWYLAAGSRPFSQKDLAQFQLYMNPWDEWGQMILTAKLSRKWRFDNLVVPPKYGVRGAEYFVCSKILQQPGCHPKIWFDNSFRRCCRCSYSPRHIFLEEIRIQ